jgi:hypothetical protein
MDFNNQRIIQNELSSIREAMQKSMPDNPALWGWKSYCQCDEDGIINECLTRIAQTVSLNGTCLEIGCGNGTENNTHQLILNGFKGIWVDGSASNISYIHDILGSLSFDRLQILLSTMTLKNIDALIESSMSFFKNKFVDFLGVDIDGNDLPITRTILNSLTPKLICVEYNAKFPPPVALTVQYNQEHSWENDDYFGASLQAWVEALEEYRLVCCNLSGCNAFFVHQAYSSVFTSYSVEKLYQPQRFWLALERLGHQPSLKWLRQVLNEPEKRMFFRLNNFKSTYIS